MIDNRLGVYRVGDMAFYSKIEAIEWQTRTGIHPHWDFNEQVFGVQDWTTEPTESLLDLYRRRALQLREKYDYLVLMFSGGADSTNVLDAFLKNDIRLDEIASYVNYDVTGDKDNYLNAEIFRVVLPKIETLRETWPDIKYSTIDLFQMTMDFFQDPGNRFDWLYNQNMMFTPNAAARESLALKVPGWANVINSGRRLCVIWAHDKPRIMHENGRWSFRFIDILDNGPTVKSMTGQLPYHDELFYWSPDLPAIVIKQAHVIKNYLMKDHVQSLPFVSQIKSDLAYRTVGKTKYWLSNHGLHTLIYPHWDINTFTNGKPASCIWSPRDTWFFDQGQHSLSKHNWIMGIDKIWQLVPDAWKNDPADPTLRSGLVACWSPDYFLN